MSHEPTYKAFVCHGGGPSTERANMWWEMSWSSALLTRLFSSASLWNISNLAPQEWTVLDFPRVSTFLFSHHHNMSGTCPNKDTNKHTHHIQSTGEKTSRLKSSVFQENALNRMLARQDKCWWRVAAAYCIQRDFYLLSYWYYLFY